MSGAPAEVIRPSRAPSPSRRPVATASCSSRASEHPRGGYQLRVYAADGEALTELEVDGQPLVPFVATDVAGAPVSVDCGDEGSS